MGCGVRPSSSSPTSIPSFRSEVGEHVELRGEDPRHAAQRVRRLPPLARRWAAACALRLPRQHRSRASDLKSANTLSCVAKTLDTQLNVFADFRPSLGDGLRRAPFVFLANIDPELQLDVLRQMQARPRLVALDTMNFWIQGKQEALRRVLAEADVVTINDGEARQLASEPNLVRAARAIAALGPRTVVVKRGEYGALMMTDGAFFFVPAYPLESVYDPTGAGDRKSTR